MAVIFWKEGKLGQLGRISSLDTLGADTYLSRLRKYKQFYVFPDLSVAFIGLFVQVRT